MNITAYCHVFTDRKDQFNRLKTQKELCSILGIEHLAKASRILTRYRRVIIMKIVLYVTIKNHGE